MEIFRSSADMARQYHEKGVLGAHLKIISFAKITYDWCNFNTIETRGRGSY